MIINKTPFRVSFVGGGSDLEDFYQKSPGAVLSVSINKYMYISSHGFFDLKQIRMKYSKTETVTDISEFKHPIVREVLRKFNITGALEINSNADIPAGSGLGSSSSFTVGLLHNLYTKVGQFVTKEKLAEEACDIEINILKEPIGKQDQYAVVFGGLNVIRFKSSGAVDVEPIYLKKEIYKSLENNLVMFYTGVQRTAASILLEQKKNMQRKDKFEILKEMAALVNESRDVLYGGGLYEFGKILHRNWLLKQQLSSKISNQDIKDVYDKAMKNGAVGGKLLGAGGGGFFLFYCEEKNQEKLRAAMRPLRELNFEFESEGSKVVYIDEYE